MFEFVFVFVHVFVFVFLVSNKVYLPEVCLTDVGRENRWRGRNVFEFVLVFVFVFVFLV